jgi:hypothetical protein
MSSTDSAIPHELDRDAAPDAPAVTRRLWFYAVIAAIAAAALAWLIGETGVVKVAAKHVSGTFMGQPFSAVSKETLHAATLATAIRMYGVFGGLLGFALGLVGTTTARPAHRRGTGLLVGLIVGTLGGALTPAIAIPLYDRYHESIESDLLASMLMHGAVWGTIGGAGGLALALGLKAGRRDTVLALAGGVLGGLIGTALYEVTGALLFVTDEPGGPISLSSRPRLFARLIVAVCVAIGASAAFGKRSKRKQPSGSGPDTPVP